MPSKKQVIIIIAISMLVSLQGRGKTAETKYLPQTIIIRKCLETLGTSDNAQLKLHLDYYDDKGKENVIDYKGVIDFPGNLDGSLKITVEQKIQTEGRIIAFDGRTYLQKPNDKNWYRIEPNSFNTYEMNPLLNTMQMIHEVTSHPEYLQGSLEHMDKTINEKRCDYFKLQVDVAKLKTDSTKTEQPENLKYFTGNFTGKNATIEMLVEKQTNHLLELKIIIDSWGKYKKPLKAELFFSEYNLPIQVERPKFYI